MSAGTLSMNAPAGPDGSRVVQATDEIQLYAARMNRLIGDLYDVVSIDAGRLAVTLIPGDCADLLADAVNTFRSAAAARELSLGLETIEAPLMADFDHGRMLQVLANLIANSIKFTDSGGIIRVRGERMSGEVVISVRDTGAGLPADMLELVFERFWQIGKNDRRGLGLGLYISRCIVEAHGGKIWAESSPGLGSEFRFTLPRSRGADRDGAPTT